MWCFLQHYGWQSKNVNIISVSDEMKKFVENGEKGVYMVHYLRGGVRYNLFPMELNYQGS